MKTTRRNLITAAPLLAVPAAAKTKQSGKEAHYSKAKPASTPIYSEAISYGNLVFVSGHGVNDVCRFQRVARVRFAKSQPGGLAAFHSAVRTLALTAVLLSALTASSCLRAALPAPSTHLQARDANMKSLLLRYLGL